MGALTQKSGLMNRFFGVTETLGRRFGPVSRLASSGRSPGASGAAGGGDAGLPRRHAHQAGGSRGPGGALWFLELPTLFGGYNHGVGGLAAFNLAAFSTVGTPSQLLDINPHVNDVHRVLRKVLYPGLRASFSERCKGLFSWGSVILGLRDKPLLRQTHMG